MRPILGPGLRKIQKDKLSQMRYEFNAVILPG